MPLERDIERFPSSVYLGDERLRDLDRRKKIQYRDALFGQFIEEDPVRAEEYMNLPTDDDRISVRDAFVAKISSDAPDVFSMTVREAGTEKVPANPERYSAMVAAARSQGKEPPSLEEVDTVEREVEELRSQFRDSATENVYDLILSGDLDPKEFDFDGMVVLGELFEERQHTEKSEEIRQAMRERAQDMGVEPRGRFRAFMEEAVVEPARFTAALLNIGNPMAAPRTLRNIQSLKDRGELGISSVIAAEEDLIRDQMGTRTRFQDAIAEEAFPEEAGPELAGAIAGVLGATVTGYVGLSRQGITSFLRRTPGARKYVIDFQNLGKGAAIEGFVGAAYADKLPGLTAEMLDQPDNRVLTALEIAALGSLFNIGIDRVRLMVQGSKTGRAVKEDLSANLPQETKDFIAAKGLDLDDIVRTVEDAALEAESAITPSVARTLDDARHSIVSYEGRVGTLTELEDGTIAVRSGDGPDMIIEGAGKDFSRSLSDLGVVEVKPYSPRSVTVSENSIKIGDSEFQRPADLSRVFNTDPDGNIISLNLRAMDGSPRTIHTPVEVEQLADTLLDRQIVQSGRAKEMVRNLPEPDSGNTRAVRSREFLTNLSRRTNPTSRAVVEAIDIGESVLPGGQLVGGTPDFARQFSKTLSRRNLRIAKANIQSILEDVQKNKDLRASRKTKLIRDLENKLGAIELYEQGKLFPAGVRAARGDSPGGLEAIREIADDLGEGSFRAIESGDFQAVPTKDLRAAARSIGVRSPSRLRKPQLIEALEDALATPTRSQDAPPIRGFPEPDDTPVQRKSPRVEPNDEDFRYTIFRGETFRGTEIPGAIQIDDLVQPGRVTNIDAAKQQGIELPQPPDWLPSGRYTLGDIRRAIRQGPPESSPGALPSEEAIQSSLVDDDVARLEQQVSGRVGQTADRRARREVASTRQTDEVLQEAAEREKRSGGTQQASNPDGSNGGEVMNQRPSDAALLSGDEVVVRTVQDFARTLDTKLGAVGMDQEKIGQIRRIASNWIFKGGSMPSEFFEQLQIGKARIRAIEDEAMMLSKKVERSIRQAVKEGLGNDTEVRQMIRDGMVAVRSIDSLPETIRETTKFMRNFLTKNSQRAIAEGVVNGELAGTFMDTSQRWMTRAYRAFTDPDWRLKIPAEDYDYAVDWIQHNWRDYQLDKALAKRIDKFNKRIEQWETARDKALAQGKTPPERPNIRMPRRDPDHIPEAITREQAAQIADDLIDPLDFNGFWMPRGGTTGKIAGKDIGVLMKRKNVPEPIRRLLGEITDPVEAFVHSARRQANLIENHKTQEAIRELGLELGYFRRGKKGQFRAHMGSTQPSQTQIQAQRQADEVAGQFVGDPNAPVGAAQIFRSTSGKYDVWDGIYARADIFRDMQQWARVHQGFTDTFTSMWTQGIGLFKFSATILNFPAGHVVNGFGAVNNIVQQGHINPRKFLQGIQTILKNNYGTEEGLAELRRKLIRNNLLNQNVNIRDVERSLRFVRESNLNVINTPKKALNFLVEAWKGPDDMAKAVAWLGEEARYGFKRAALGEEAFEKFLANRVAATQQMYDRVPTWMRNLSRFEAGVVNFMAFPYDQSRIAVNTAKMVVDDMIDAGKALAAGKTEDALGFARAAAERGAAFGAIAGSGGYALQSYFHSRNEIDDETFEDLKPWVAPFFRRETIAFMENPRETGRAVPQIVSYNLPNENWMKIVRNAFRAWEDPDGNPAESVWEDVKGQFFGGGMMTGKLANLRQGRDEFGREIPGGKIDRVRDFISGAEPGVMRQIRKIAQVYTEEQKRFGREDGLGDIVKFLLGQRRYPVDVEKAIPDNFRFTWLNFQEATRDYQSAERRNIQGGQLNRQYQSSEITRRDQFDHMVNMVRSLERTFGKSPQEVNQLLRRHARMSNEDIRRIRSGEYRPMERTVEE